MTLACSEVELFELLELPEPDPELPELFEFEELDDPLPEVDVEVTFNSDSPVRLLKM